MSKLLRQTKDAKSKLDIAEQTIIGNEKNSADKQLKQETEQIESSQKQISDLMIKIEAADKQLYINSESM